MFCLGNLGFDSDNNYYNPNYFSTSDELSFNIYGSASIYAEREYSQSRLSSNKTRVSKGNFYLKPNFGMQYRLGEYLLSINYQNNLLFNRKLYDTRLQFGTEYGVYGMFLDESDLKIKNDVLQMSVSKKFSDNFSISIGASTNYFDYNLEYNYTDSSQKSVNNIELYSSGFSNPQFLFSLNYKNPEDISIYLLYRTQTKKIDLRPDSFSINGFPLISNWSEINYLAHLAYGIQVNSIESLKISIELFHKLIFSGNVYNTTINMGVNKIFNDNFILGLVILYPIKLVLPIQSDIGGETTTSDNSSFRPYNRFSFIISSSYQYEKIKFFLSYQYSKLASNSNFIEVKDLSQILNLGFNYSIL